MSITPMTSGPNTMPANKKIATSGVFNFLAVIPKNEPMARIRPNVNNACLAISIDADDNKFVDCAIASDTNYLVTNDKHFDILQSIEFPKVETITARDFLSILKSIK